MTKLRNDGVVVPLNQQRPLNASGLSDQDEGSTEGLLLSSIDPDLADAAVSADSKALDGRGSVGEGQAAKVCRPSKLDISTKSIPAASQLP